MDHPFITPACLSIGPGIRGIERGVERITGRIKTVAYVEIEAFIIANLVAAMEQGILDSAPIWSDVKTLNAEIFRDRVDGIFAGYPCQPFSVAGKRGGVEDARHLFPYIAEHIRVIRPTWCFFENVPGHLTLGYPEVRSTLQRLGYYVEEGIFSAEETGAAHRRERLFILAVSMGYTQHNGSLAQQILRGNETTGVERWSKESPEARQSSGADRPVDGTGLQGSFDGGEQLDNSSSNRSEQVKQISTRRNSVECSGKELADSAEFGMEGYGPEGQQVADLHEQKELLVCSGRRVVARPGQQQYEWEQPRTLTPDQEEIEPPLGLTVNGYNFREDFLRALGNSVYADTAELAFKTLLKKHELI